MISSTPPKTVARDRSKNDKIAPFFGKKGGNFLCGLFHFFLKNHHFFTGGPSFLFLSFCQAVGIPYPQNTSSRSVQNRRNQPPRLIIKKRTTCGLFVQNDTFFAPFWRFFDNFGLFWSKWQKWKKNTFNFMLWTAYFLETARRDHAEGDEIQDFWATWGVKCCCSPHTSRLVLHLLAIPRTRSSPTFLFRTSCSWFAPAKW